QAARVAGTARRPVRAMQDPEGLQAGLAAGLDRVPLEAVALDAHRRRRVAQRLAVGAALDQQLALLTTVPEEAGVIALARQWALGLGRVLGFGFGLGRLGALRRLELEHAEQLAADLFVTGAVFPLGEVGHQYGHEEPGTQRRALRLADAVQLAGDVQTLAGHDRPAEVQVGVHRHHRRPAV